ncbi:hypothetical protein BsWGS_27198 [Bradybaena similaris]
MASTVVENVMGVAEFPSLSHAPDQHTSESSHLYNIEEKSYSESYSVYRSSTTITKSGSPGGNYDYSSFSNQSRDCTNKNGEQAKSYLEENSASLKSNYSSYDFEKILNDSALQQRLKQEPGSQSSINELLGGNFNSYKAKTVGLEKPAENKWDFKSDYTSYAAENNSTNGDKNKQKYEKFSNAEFSSNIYKTKSQSFDFDQLMQTYSCEASKDAAITSEVESDASRKLQTKPSYGFEASEAAIRLRNSVQSNFLSSELWKAAPPQTEDSKSQGNSAIRTIEEILKQHGISDNIPTKSSCTVNDTGKKATNSSTKGQINLSQNNESSSGLIRAAGSETGQSFSYTQDKDSCNTYAFSGSKDMNSSYRTDPAAGSARSDPKNFTSQGTTSFTTNTSQNNETTKSLNTGDTDPLKRYGSSVDYNTSTGKYGLQSGSTNFRMYDFGKSTLSGDNARSSMLFSTMDSKKYEGNTDMGKFDAPQTDGTAKFNASKASHIDIIKNMGSATDALEYSMSTERQRLRKLDTMISSTPVNYSSLEVPRSLRADYLSPERTYSSLIPSDLPSRKMYSTSNMASTSAHGAGYSTRNHMSGSAGQRDSGTVLNKSISAPGSAGMQSVAKYGSSVDGRPTYWPFGTKRDYNRQYNNAYNPQLLEKFVNQKTDNNQKKLPGSKKKECPFKSKKEESTKKNDHLLMYPQNPTGIHFLNNSQMKKPVTGEKKKVSGKLEAKKKTADKDLNHSKTLGGLYDGFDFVKDLNRLWQETVFGQTSKPAPNPKGKYIPYKPASQDKKEAKPTNAQGPRNMLSGDLWQPSLQRSDSNWTLNGSTAINGKLSTYGRDYGLQSVPKVQSQSSLGASSIGQTKSKGSNSSLAKNRPNATSALMTKQSPATPKSILKQSNSKTGCMSSNVGRPQSSRATSSKSCTQTAYLLPYHLIRSFSPVEPHKASRSNTSALVKKQEPSTNKRLVSRTGTIPKQGRRI